MKTLLLVAVMLVAGAGWAGAQTVRIATEGAYPPFNFVNDSGKIDGFERALGDDLCQRAHLTCSWVTNDWDSIIPDLVAGKYDAVMAGLAMTPEREKVIAFSQAYALPAASAYMGLKADADTAGVIAVQTGTVQADYISRTDATMIEFPTADAAVDAVRKGEADAVLADRAYLAPIVAASGGAFAFAGKPMLIGPGVGIGLRKGDTALKAAFDAAIGAMKADGSLNALIRKWFGADAETF